MSFKKTVTFTANVSDYTDGTVSARVQAENKILGDLVAFILAQNLDISVQEKVSIGDAMWSGNPFYCSTSGATTDVNNNSLAGDFYFLGRGMSKKCLGLSVDNHNLFIGLSDTPTYDLTFPGTLGNYGRVPCAQTRYLKSANYLTNRENYRATVPLAVFPTNTDELSMSVKYWKSESCVVIKSNDYNIIVSKEPYTALITGTGGYKGIHFSFDDDFLVSLASYSFSADNTNYASNVALGYAMSNNPFCVKGSNRCVWETPNNESSSTTSILCHAYGRSRGSIANNSVYPDSNSNGLSADGNMPTVTAFGFPRIANNELYIKKMYVPMTYPAVTSPAKIGYTPGKLNAENVYSLGDKTYLSLHNGVIGLFVEVADQG